MSKNMDVPENPGFNCVKFCKVFEVGKFNLHDGTVTVP